MAKSSMASNLPSAPMSRWQALFPPAPWLPRDLIAGVTLAAYAVPVSMAYASLAGLAPRSA